MNDEDEKLCDDCGNKLDGQPKYRDNETLCENCYASYVDTHAQDCAECKINLDGQGEWYNGKMLCHDCYEEITAENDYWRNPRNWINGYDDDDPDATPGLSGDDY